MSNFSKKNKDDVKRYTLGSGQIPKWFENECSLGRARVNYNDDGDIECVTIHTPTKTLEAFEGDEVVLSKSGLGVVKKEVKPIPVENVED